MGDFTFPATTTAAAAPTPAEPGGPAPCRLQLPQFAAPPIWFPPSPAAADDDMAAEEESPPPPEEAVEAGAEAAQEDEPPKEEDRMDLLWEDFNEELDAALRRAGSCSRAAAAARYGGLGPSSDVESEPAMRSHHGCVPVLRPSSRVGGAGHYRRRAGSWVLLMRIFRRLFVIDKTVARRHATSA